MLLVTRVVDARDHLVDAVLLARDLADDHVVLVVAGQRQDEVRRTLDARAFERVELGRVADLHLVLELALEHLVPVAALLDQGQLVAEAEQRPRHVRPDLAASGDDRVHAQASTRSAVSSTDSVSASIAVMVGHTVRSPRSA